MDRIADIVSAEVLERIEGYAEAFQNAKPYEHVVIDGFFQEAFLQRLLAEFPETQIDENDRAKRARQDFPDLGPAYAELDGLIQSQDFLDTMTRVSGIEGLLYDETYQGGGTHENFPRYRHMSHIDYNYHPQKGWHRRLNLIVYITPEWREEWGGAICLYENGRKPHRSGQFKVPCLQNRAILFATHLRSWHGVETISFPEGTPVRSRKSIALYFFSKHRPAYQIDKRFQTQFYPRELPAYVTEAHGLTDTQREELENYQDMVMRLVSQRYTNEQEWLAQVDKLRDECGHLREAIQTLKAEVAALKGRPLTTAEEE